MKDPQLDFLREILSSLFFLLRTENVFFTLSMTDSWAEATDRQLWDIDIQLIPRESLLITCKVDSP